MRALKFFPVPKKAWGLRDLHEIALPRHLDRFHIAPSCQHYHSGSLVITSTGELADEMCPHCAALAGSSDEFLRMMTYDTESNISEVAYAMMSSWLYANTTFKTANPCVAGWLYLEASKAANSGIKAAGLLDAPLSMSSYKVADFYSSAMLQAKKVSDKRVMTISIPDLKTPTQLVLAPYARLVGGYLVVPDTPDIETNHETSSYEPLCSDRLPLLDMFLLGGMRPEEAYTAASVI